MLKRIKNLLEHNAILIAIALTITIIYLSLASTMPNVMEVNVSDKILHTFAYFGLSTSWFFAIKASYNNFNKKVIIAFLVLFFSVLLEFLQGSLTNYRTADYYDIVANSIGIVIAVISFNTMIRLYNAI